METPRTYRVRTHDVTVSEKDGRFTARCYLGRDGKGKRIEPKRRGTNLDAVLQAIESDLMAYDEGLERNGARTLSMAVDDWLPTVLGRETGRGPLTLTSRQKHEWIADSIKADRVGSKRLGSLVTAEPLQGFLERRAESIGRDSLRRTRKALIDVFRHESAHGRWNRPNWGELLVIPAKARRGQAPTVLDLDATKHFLGSIKGTELEAAWRLHAIYGLRPGEGRGLLVCNVHIDDPEPHVVLANSTTTNDEGHEVVGPLKKDHHRARCPLDDDTVRALREQFERLEFRGSTCGLMFPSGNDTLISKNNYVRRFRTALRDAGFSNDEDFTPYDLRHTSATLLNQEFGWSKAEVADHLRHINLATVSTYLHPDEIRMRPSPIATT